MNEEVKETVLTVSDYTKMTLKKRLFRLSIIALAGVIVSVMYFSGILEKIKERRNL